MARRWKVINKKTGRVVRKSLKPVKARAKGVARHMNALHCTRRYVVVEA
jgi:hypothetical protein